MLPGQVHYNCAMGELQLVGSGNGLLSNVGDVERYKAHLVAHQKYGFDYEETFSPVVRFADL